MGEQQKLAPAGVWTGNPRHVADLDFSPADDGFIVYHPASDRVHFLNPTAVLILELCNGENSPEQIVELVQKAYNLPDAPVKEVNETLELLKDGRLLLQSGETA